MAFKDYLFGYLILEDFWKPMFVGILELGSSGVRTIISIGTVGGLIFLLSLL